MRNHQINYEELQIDRNSAEPVHMQLSRQLRRQIRMLPPNSDVQLLSERKLTEMYQFGRSTVHRAYMELMNQGLVESQPDKSLRIAADFKNLLRGTFPAIGIILPERFSNFLDRTGQIPMFYLRGIFDRCAELKYATMMLQLPELDATSEHVGEFLESEVSKLNGVIHFGDREVVDDMPLRRLLDYPAIPQLFISGTSSLDHIGSVAGDTASGGEELVEKLRELGHRTIAFFSYQQAPYVHFPEKIFHYEGRVRGGILLELMARRGIVCPEKFQLCGDCSPEQLKNKLMQMMRDPAPPTALLCINDDLARLSIRLLATEGFKVPEDISVIGFDGGMETDDELTTILLPFYEIGSRAVDVLKDQYENGIHIGNRLTAVPTRLLLQKTLGPAPGFAAKCSNSSTRR